MKNPSISGSGRTAHNFSRVPKAEIQRSVFDRSHTLKTTFSGTGGLIPVFVDEVLPGDTFNLKMTSFCRLSTFKRPIMDNLYLDVFFFFVPNRLVWDNWEAFCGYNAKPSSGVVQPGLVLPFIDFKNAQGNQVVPGSCTLYDYFGLPILKQLGPSPAIAPNPLPFQTGLVNALPFRGYNLIYNEWFRDENLIDPVYFSTSDDPDNYLNFNVLRRGKRHDYFTSALPWPQKGPVVTIGSTSTPSIVSGPSGVPLFTNSSAGTTTYTLGSTASSSSVFWLPTPVSSSQMKWSDPQLKLSSSIGSTFSINELRQGFQVQRLYERDARGGTRYVEVLKSHFGVTSPDARLQRPEYLGGGTVNINVNPIANTGSGTGSTTTLGELGAVGTAAVHGVGFTKSFVEHGYVFGLVSARSDMTYQQGLPKMYMRKTRFDFYWPVLAHLGEQVIYNAEIYYSGSNVTNSAGTAYLDSMVFGYQERYAEYRYKPSQITGLFRSAATAPLDNWHLAQNFGSLPTLSQTFIEESVPMARVEVVNVPNGDFLFDAHFKLKCVRPMPIFGVPGLIDHF